MTCNELIKDEQVNQINFSKYTAIGMSLGKNCSYKKKKKTDSDF